MVMQTAKTCMHNGMLVHENEFRDKDFYSFSIIICQVDPARRQPSDLSVCKLLLPVETILLNVEAILLSCNKA